MGSGWKKPDMVDWYAPAQLLTTGLQTLLSTRLGAMIDNRRFVNSSSSAGDGIVDLSIEPDGSPRATISFDFMADTGDGWFSTYSMALLLTLPELQVGTGRIPRSDFLVLGGDQVYPVASKDEYARRLVWPFNEASRTVRGLSEPRIEKRDVFLTPGNHDWYDSLSSLTHRFVVGPSGKGKEFGSFRTRQNRSYFLIKLPHDWQIWAIDIQLERALNVEQDYFFSQEAKKLTPRNKVILCSAEPGLVYGRSADEKLVFNLKRMMRYIENSGARVVLQLAGDVHNYQHYEVDHQPERGAPSHKQHRVVAGGGGAFLHPTHAFPDSPDPWRQEENVGEGPADGDPAVVPADRDDDAYRPKVVYPPASTSFKLSHRLFAFAFTHMSFSCLLGLFYLMIFGSFDFAVPLWSLPWRHPLSSAWALLLVGGCVAFADQKGVGKILVGLGHAAAHLIAGAIAWIAVRSWQPVEQFTWFQLYVALAGLFVYGGVVGGTIFGAYLWLTLNLLKSNHNQAFSALAIQDYKCLLRCQIDDAGTLRVKAIGVERMVRDVADPPPSVHLIETFLIDG